MIGNIEDFRISHINKYAKPSHIYVRMFSGLVLETKKNHEYINTLNYQGRFFALAWRLVKLNVEGKNNTILFRWS